MLTVPDQRIVRGHAATLRFTNTDGEGAATEPAGTVTVGVTRADGTVLVAAGTATVDEAATGLRTKALTAAQTADLDLLTCTWTDGGDDSAHVTLVEIAGAHYFSVADARAYDDSITVAKYSDAKVIAARRAVESECEQICGVAFVPRFRRLTLDGPGEDELQVPDNRLRELLTASIDGVALTDAQLAETTVATDRVIRRPAGVTWTQGRSNIVVAYTHGYDRPPLELVEAMLLRLRHYLNRPRSGILDRATSFSPAEGGGTYKLDTPSAWRTGIPDVDAVYSRYSERSSGGGADSDGAPRPAYGRFDLNPQADSLFHSGRR